MTNPSTNPSGNVFLRVFFAVVLLAGCLAAGFYLSQVKPLWNDEVFTQVEGIETHSYGQIILGRLEEGNNCPLFYLLQKAQCDFFGYRFPQEWNGEWNVYEPFSQVFLRVLPNLYMSLAILILFLFFWQRYSVLAALYVLVLVFSSPMVWRYWAEARPYGLWFLLTVLQSVCLAGICRGGRDPRRLIWGLAGVHLLLSLTVTLSVVQIAAAAAVLFVFCPRDCRKQVWAAAAPALVGLYYYLHSPRFKLWFSDNGIMPLIADNIPVDRMALLAVCAGLAVYAMLREDSGRAPEEGGMREERPFLVYALGMGILTAGILAYLKLIDEGGPEGFSVSSRYFIYLTPLAVMAAGVMTVRVWRALKENPWLRLNFAIIVTGLCVMRVFQSYAAMMTALSQ